MITAEAGVLARAMKDVAPLARGGDVAAFKMVLIEAGDDVRLTTSNGSQQMTRVVAAESDRSEAFCVEALRLSAILAALDAGAMVQMVTGDGKMIVKSGRSRFTFPTLDAATFPLIPREGGAELELGEDFLRALAGVRHAVCTNEVQWHMCGVFLAHRNGKLDVGALDGSRVAVWTLGEGEIPDTMLPTVLADTLTRIAPERIAAQIGERSAWFDMGDTIVTTKKIEAEIQPYQRILGMKPEVTVSLDRKPMMAALSRLLIVAEDKDRMVKLEIGRDAIVATNLAGEEHIPASADGEITIGFKVQYLRDALDAIDADQVDLRLAGVMLPAEVRADGVAGVAALMPYRI